MLKSLTAAVLIIGGANAFAAYPIGVPDVYEPILPRLVEQTSSALDDLMTPDEIAKEAGIPTQEEKWAQGNYEDLLWKTARTQKNAIQDRRVQIVVTKSNQQMKVYEYGRLLHTYKVSTGRNQMETAKSGKKYRTVTGSGYFTINSMTKMHISNTWGGAKMPFAIFFNGGIAVHATTPDHYEELGRTPGKTFKNSKGRNQMAGSGGCVRLHLEHAKVVYALVQNVGAKNVGITVLD